MSRYQLERMLATRIAPASRAWRQLGDETLAELRVSNSTGWCLVYMDRLGPDVRQIDLARTIGISQPSLVRLLHQLEASGLIERQPDPDDRRTNRVLLTDQGRELAASIEQRLGAMRNDLLHDVSDADIRAALHVCETLSRRIAERRAQP
ncbi:MAG: MarR family transcriptional regulator [Sphingobium sp.]|nr:MAG: MarR family transcriptional regulator [Sphingobium sp.]